MVKFKCKSCGKIHDIKPEACECKHTEFEEVKVEEPKQNDDQVEILKQQIEMMNKQMELMQANSDAEKKKAEQEVEAEKLKNMNEQERLQHEKNKQQQDILDQQTKMLEEMEKIKVRNETLEKENSEREFKNKKLMLCNESPFLKDKIDLCENQQELDYLFKFINIEEEKAKYEANNNGSGSILNIEGTLSKSQVNKPKSIGEKLEAKRQQKLQELKEKKNRRRY
jgi:hypothetical protein